VVSFNDEGYLRRAELERMLGARAHLLVLEIPYGRYVGAKIGIHNPRGERVGTVGHLTNVEHLFIASDRELDLPAAAARRAA
jgi:adenine-specific DNA-methyltransferase